VIDNPKEAVAMTPAHRITTAAVLVAGLAAAGGLAITMIGVGGALGAAQYRTRRTRGRAVQPS
jgi:hypothetical protein